ncbi:hypothetical protein HY229_01075 [Candidatus Acetothermia bacterium]|nr:hypothetical protein [Candidatus Acetothermia bacterium]MBI3642683.1 hypothetical protein [Candidatus Acetothermia bacterium]
MLKWSAGNEAAQVQQKINSFVMNASNSKVIYVLIALAGFVVLAAAGDKWGG